MSIRFRAAFSQCVLVLALKTLPVSAAAEEFKYYVWIDEQGIVHAEEDPPKGVDYEVRVIEDINANVVPVEDFRLYGDVPVDPGADSGNETGGSAASTGSQSEDGGAAITPQDPDLQR